ncbi:hypothetical protein Bbelb_154100 [Branchiostoma belcheri]|nr:hypothetical protein Bbelb_154100 [Branchiostoma belcheri]
MIVNTVTEAECLVVFQGGNMFCYSDSDCDRGAKCEMTEKGGMCTNGDTNNITPEQTPPEKQVDEVCYRHEECGVGRHCKVDEMVGFGRCRDGSPPQQPEPPSKGFNSAIIQPNDLKFGMEVEGTLQNFTSDLEGKPWKRVRQRPGWKENFSTQGKDVDDTKLTERPRKNAKDIQILKDHNRNALYHAPDSPKQSHNYAIDTNN